MNAQVTVLTARPRRLFEALVSRIRQDHGQGREVLVLVPEQLTVATERMLMDELKLDCMFSPVVVSPTRLYSTLIEEIGTDKKQPLSEMGFLMALSQTLESVSKNLTYYGTSAGSHGFLARLSALMTDMKRGGLNSGKLREASEKSKSDVTRSKLADLALICEGYEDLLNGRFSENEDPLVYLAGRVSETAFFEGKRFYVYGFDSLTEDMIRFLTAVAPLCEAMTVALLCERKAEDNPASSAYLDGALYEPVRQGIDRFLKKLRQNGITACWMPLPVGELDSTDGIRALDKSFLSEDAPALLDTGDDAEAFWASSPAAEAELVSRRILALLEEGVSLDRICVLYPENKGYEFAAAAAMTDAGIPFFNNRQLPVLCHPLVRFLLLALKAMEAKPVWSCRVMFPLLHSGFVPLSYEECCLLENYATEFGIDGKRWQEPFTRGPEERRAACEEYRLKLMTPLIRARAALALAEDAADSAKAVFDLLEEIEAYSRLQEEEAALEEGGFHTRSAQNSQIWKTLTELLEDAVRLDCERRIPICHIADRLESGLSARSLAAIPPTGSILHMGVLGHMLEEESDYVFLMGMNEGILSRETDSLLRPDERDEIVEIENQDQEADCFLGLTDESRLTLARLDLKRAMTLPRKKLILSCSTSSFTGEEQQVLAELLSLKPVLDLTQGKTAENPRPLPLSTRQAERILCGMDPRDDLLQTKEWKKRLALLAEEEESRREIVLTQPDFAAGTLTPEQARILYTRKMLSVSRLENFAGCPFRHYLQYGLRPLIPAKWEYDASMLGTYRHAGLEAFAKQAAGNPAYPKNREGEPISPDELKKMTDAAEAEIRRVAAEGGVLEDGPRNQAMLDHICAEVTATAELVTQDLAKGSFRLKSSELSFGFGEEGGASPIVLPLRDGTETALQGRIDRVDSWTDPEGNEYLRVVDYKSSNKGMDLGKVEAGLQLQLLMYLEQVCADGGKPGGVFYTTVDDPLTKQKDDDPIAAEEALKKEFKPKGLSLADRDVLLAMDEKNSLCTKDGIRRDAAALTEDEFRACLANARKTAISLAEGMFEGQNAASPCRSGTENECSLCDYKGLLCPFNPLRHPYRDIPKIKIEDFRAKLAPDQEHP